MAVAGAAAAATGRRLDSDALWPVVRDAEAQAIKVPTGVQDYLAAIHGGVLGIHLDPGALRVEKLATDPAKVEESIMLVDSAVSHFSGLNNWEVFKGQIEKDENVRRNLADIVAAARDMRDALVEQRYGDVPAIMTREMEARKRLAPGVSTPEIEKIAEAARLRGRRGQDLRGRRRGHGPGVGGPGEEGKGRGRDPRRRLQDRRLPPRPAGPRGRLTSRANPRSCCMMGVSGREQTMIQATGLKRGMCIKHDNGLYRVVEAQHKTPGNLRGLVQAKIRNLKNGAISEHRFRSVDMVERAILDDTEMEFLYQDGDMFHFMNNETYEQIGLSAEVLGDAVPYLTPNIKLKIEMYEDRPVGIELPAHRGDDDRGDGARDQGRVGVQRGQAGQDGDRAHRAGPGLRRRRRAHPHRHRDRLVHRARQVAAHP